MKIVSALIAEIVIIRENKDNYHISTYNDVWDLNPNTDNYYFTGHIEIGNIISFENKQYKVNEISLRLIPNSHNIVEEIDIFSKEANGFNNFSILVSVEEI